MRYSESAFKLRCFLPALVVLSLTAPAGAVDFGWQMLPDGGIEYRVQVEPSLVDSFRQEGFTSEVPPGLRDIRRIRIEVGSGRLPNQGDSTGPKITKSVLAPSEPKVAEQAPTTGPQTFGAGDTKPPTPPAESPVAQESNQVLVLPPPPETAQQVPHLPFFQPGPAKTIDKPALAASDDADRTATERRTVQAAMPATENSGTDAGNVARRSTIVPVSKPWTALMAVLLALFASLGANIYLAWIHQQARAKYQTLAAQMHGGATMS